jgi:hypothetical protein
MLVILVSLIIDCIVNGTYACENGNVLNSVNYSAFFNFMPTADYGYVQLLKGELGFRGCEGALIL